VVLSPAVRTIGFCLLGLLPLLLHCVDFVPTVRHDNSDWLTGECFRADRLPHPPPSLGSSSFSFSQWLLSLALWSCGRRVSGVQAQRQIHRAFRPRCPGSQSFAPSLQAGFALGRSADSAALSRVSRLNIGRAGQSRAGWAMRAIAQMKPTISRAIAVVTRTFGLPDAANRRYRAHSRTCAFHAMSRMAADSGSRRS
jgi:hypothetical protein